MKFDIFRNIDFDHTSDVPLDALSPQLQACLDYWQDVAGGDAMPPWRRIDLSVLPGDVLPLVTVIDIDWGRGVADADAFSYRYWGTGHVRAKNVERTGKLVSEHSDRAHVVASEYLKVIEARRPVAFTKHIRINDPWRAVTQTSIRLPLSNDGVRVDNVFSASEWSPIASGG